MIVTAWVNPEMGETIVLIFSHFTEVQLVLSKSVVGIWCCCVGYAQAVG
jgi:hypothetical protein